MKSTASLVVLFHFGDQFFLLLGRQGLMKLHKPGRKEIVHLIESALGVAVKLIKTLSVDGLLAQFAKHLLFGGLFQGPHLLMFAFQLFGNLLQLLLLISL